MSSKKTYYIPNCGITCLFTDFGVSRTFSPELELSNGEILKLGTRLAIHDSENNIFIPLLHNDKDKNKIKWIEDNSIFSYPVRTYINLKNNSFHNKLNFNEIDLNEEQKNILNNNNLNENNIYNNS